MCTLEQMTLYDNLDNRDYSKLRTIFQPIYKCPIYQYFMYQFISFKMTFAVLQSRQIVSLFVFITVKLLYPLATCIIFHFMSDSVY